MPGERMRGLERNINERRQLPPKPEENKKEKHRVVFARDEDAILSRAKDEAEKRMTASEKELQGSILNLKKTIKRIWKHNVAEAYYKEKEITAAKKRIEGSKDLYVDVQGIDQQAKDDAAKAVVDRFATEYEDAYNKEAGEKRETLAEKNVNEAVQSQIKDEMRKLMFEYGAGKYASRDDFEAARARKFAQIPGAPKELSSTEANLHNNLFEIAEHVKAKFDHERGLEQVDLDFDVYIAKAKGGVRTEAHQKGIDKATDWIRSRMNGKGGAIVNEATVVGAVSLAYSMTAKVGQSAFRRTLGFFGLGAAAAGGMAYLRRRTKVEDDRAQHARQKAMGMEKEDEKNSPYRDEMEKSRIETRSSEYLYNELNTAYEQYKTSNSEESIRLVYARLAEIEARTHLSDTQDIDLISYSHEVKVDQERTKLNLFRAEIRADLRKRATSGDAVWQKVLAGKDFDGYLQEMRAASVKMLVKGEAGIEAKNELFAKFKNREAVKQGLKAAAFGTAIGVVTQEVGTFFNKGHYGVLEHWWDKFRGNKAPEADAAVRTPAEWLRQNIFGRGQGGGGHEAISDHISHNGESVSKIIETNGGKVGFNVPEGDSIQANPDGSFSYTHHGEELKLVMENGKLSEESIKLLHEKNLSAEGIMSGQDVVGATTERTYTTNEFVDAHRADFHKIHRDMWYDENTPAPKYEYTEKELLWGGKDGTGIDGQGNYVFNVKKMLVGTGPFHGKNAADVEKLLALGKLKILLSASKGTQSEVIEIDIDANGDGKIAMASTGGKLFSIEKGHAVYNGKYAEVGQNMDSVKNGAENWRIIATHTGKGMDTIKEAVTTEGSKAFPIISITEGAVPTGPEAVRNFEGYVYGWPTLPFVSQRGLESMKSGAYQAAEAKKPVKEQGLLGGDNRKLIGAGEAGERAGKLSAAERQDILAQERREIVESIHKGLSENPNIKLDEVIRKFNEHYAKMGWPPETLKLSEEAVGINDLPIEFTDLGAEYIVLNRMQREIDGTYKPFVSKPFGRPVLGRGSREKEEGPKKKEPIITPPPKAETKTGSGDKKEAAKTERNDKKDTVELKDLEKKYPFLPELVWQEDTEKWSADTKAKVVQKLDKVFQKIDKKLWNGVKTLQVGNGAYGFTTYARAGSLDTRPSVDNIIADLTADLKDFQESIGGRGGAPDATKPEPKPDQPEPDGAEGEDDEDSDEEYAKRKLSVEALRRKFGIPTVEVIYGDWQGMSRDRKKSLRDGILGDLQEIFESLNIPKEDWDLIDTIELLGPGVATSERPDIISIPMRPLRRNKQYSENIKNIIRRKINNLKKGAASSKPPTTTAPTAPAKSAQNNEPKPATRNNSDRTTASTRSSGEGFNNPFAGLGEVAGSGKSESEKAIDRNIGDIRKLAKQVRRSKDLEGGITKSVIDYLDAGDFKNISAFLDGLEQKKVDLKEKGRVALDSIIGQLENLRTLVGSTILEQVDSSQQNSEESPIVPEENQKQEEAVVPEEEGVDEADEITPPSTIEKQTAEPESAVEVAESPAFRRLAEIISANPQERIEDPRNKIQKFSELTQAEQNALAEKIVEAFDGFSEDAKLAFSDPDLKIIVGKDKLAQYYKNLKRFVIGPNSDIEKIRAEAERIEL